MLKRSTVQELDNLKSQPVLANDNLKTSSTPDDNLIEKVNLSHLQMLSRYFHISSFKQVDNRIAS